MADRERKHYPGVFSEQGADGDSDPVLVGDFRHIVISIGTSADWDGDIVTKGAIGNSAPTFSSAASESNQWKAIQIVRLEDGAPVDGETMIITEGALLVELYEANINALDYINFEVDNFVAGTCTISVTVTSN